MLGVLRDLFGWLCRHLPDIYPEEPEVREVPWDDVSPDAMRSGNDLTDAEIERAQAVWAELHPVTEPA